MVGAIGFHRPLVASRIGADHDASYMDPTNFNGHCLQQFAVAHGLTLSGTKDSAGRKVITWTSPGGQESCIDYIRAPAEWAECFSTEGAPKELCDLHAGFDHHVLYAELRATCRSGKRASKPRYDCQAMTTQLGQAKLENIFAGAPAVPWQDDLQKHFPPATKASKSGNKCQNVGSAPAVA